MPRPTADIRPLVKHTLDVMFDTLSENERGVIHEDRRRFVAALTTGVMDRLAVSDLPLEYLLARKSASPADDRQLSLDLG